MLLCLYFFKYVFLFSENFLHFDWFSYLSTRSSYIHFAVPLILMSCFTYLFFYLPSLLWAAWACMNMDVGGPLEKGWHPGNHLWEKKASTSSPCSHQLLMFPRVGLVISTPCWDGDCLECVQVCLVSHSSWEQQSCPVLSCPVQKTVGPSIFPEIGRMGMT